jgi:hypothetical protein
LSEAWHRARWPERLHGSPRDATQVDLSAPNDDRQGLNRKLCRK